MTTAEREGAMRAIAGYCRAEGYASIADAAASMGQTPEEFCAGFVVAVFYPDEEAETNTPGTGPTVPLDA